MRRVAGQAVICEALTTHIFRPFCIPDDLKQAADQMLGLFDEDKEQQLIYRHQVSTLLDDAEMEADADAAINAGNDILRLLDRLVPFANVEDFRRKVSRNS